MRAKFKAPGKMQRNKIWDASMGNWDTAATEVSGKQDGCSEMED